MSGHRHSMVIPHILLKVYHRPSLLLSPAPPHTLHTLRSTRIPPTEHLQNPRVAPDRVAGGFTRRSGGSLWRRSERATALGYPAEKAGVDGFEDDIHSVRSTSHLLYATLEFEYVSQGSGTTSSPPARTANHSMISRCTRSLALCWSTFARLHSLGYIILLFHAPRLLKIRL